MEILCPFLDFYIPVAIGIFAFGLSYKFARIFHALLMRHQPPSRSPNALDAPPEITMHLALTRMFRASWKQWNRKANPFHSAAIAVYHTCIITEASSYGFALLSVFAAMTFGKPIPDVRHHLTESYNYRASNALGIVFSNAKPLHAHFLFGPLGPVFTAVTSVVVICAFFAIGTLFFMHWSNNAGTTMRAIDSVSMEVKTKSSTSWQNRTLTLIIFAIICMEICGRLELLRCACLLHVFLGVTLLMLLPFTLLVHIPLSPLTLWMAGSRWRQRHVA